MPGKKKTHFKMENSLHVLLIKYLMIFDDDDEEWWMIVYTIIYSEHDLV